MISHFLRWWFIGPEYYEPGAKNFRAMLYALLRGAFLIAVFVVILLPREISMGISVIIGLASGLSVSTLAISSHHFSKAMSGR